MSFLRDFEKFTENLFRESTFFSSNRLMQLLFFGSRIISSSQYIAGGDKKHEKLYEFSELFIRNFQMAKKFDSV